MRFLLLGLILFASTARAGDDWTTGDTVRQAVVTGLLIADWGQTRWNVKHESDCNTPSGLYPRNPICDALRYETNPLLGQNPSMGRVNIYFSAAIVGHAAISYALPRGWRDGWQYVWIGIEANQVNRNRSIGIKIDF